MERTCLVHLEHLSSQSPLLHFKPAQLSGAVWQLLRVSSNYRTADAE